MTTPRDVTRTGQPGLPGTLRTLRQQRGLTLAQVGARIDRAGPTVAHWECGRHEPNTSQLIAWARALGYEVALYEPLNPPELPQETTTLLQELIDVLAKALLEQEDA